MIFQAAYLLPIMNILKTRDNWSDAIGYTAAWIGVTAFYAIDYYASYGRSLF